MKKSLKIFLTVAAVAVIGVILYAVFSRNKDEFTPNPKEGDKVTVNGVDYVFIAGKWVRKDTITGGIVSNANENRLKYEVVEDKIVSKPKLYFINGNLT